MKTFNRSFARLFLAVATLLAGLSPAFAQLTTLTTTTLGSAVTSTTRQVCLASATGVVLPTYNQAGSTLFVDHEAMRVRSQDTTLCFMVVRASRPVGHASGATVYIGDPSKFYAYDPDGTCVLGDMDVRPWINTSNGRISDCVSSQWVAINGPFASTTGVTGLTPNAAGTVDAGTALLPWRFIYFSGASGTPGTNNFKFTGTATAARTITFPDATDTLVGKATTDSFTNKSFATAGVGFTNATSGTVTVAATTGALGTPTVTLPAQTGSLPTSYFCGATTGTTTCANTATGGTARVISGLATLATGSAVLSAISPAFTSTSTFSCVGNDTTTSSNVVKIVNTSSSSITFTGTGSDVISYVCIGY